jgi:hypothetical protein
MTVILEEDYSSTAGFVYVLSNPLMPNILKIGSTERSVKERVSELSATTGIPVPFKVEYSFLTENPKEIEFYLHEQLGDFRVNGNREFFNISLDHVVEIINSIRVNKILDEIQSWGEIHVSSFAAEFQRILPKASYLEEARNSNNRELFEFLLKLPKDSIITVLHRLFQERPQIWRELK